MPAQSLSSSDLGDLSELIDHIYQGATDPSRWPAIVSAVADWTEASRALIFTPEHPLDAGGFNFSHAVPDDFMQLWATRYHQEDVWGQRAAAQGLLREGNIVVSDELIPLDELSRTPVYEVLSRFDMVHAMGSIIMGKASDVPWSTCALYRGAGEGPFTRRHRDRLSLLSSHLSRSLGVMSRLRNAELKVASTLGALDRLSVAVLLFGARGRLVFANRAAQRILGEQDGLRVRHLTGSTGLGEIVAGDRAAHAELGKAIMRAVAPDILHTEHFSRAVTVRRPSGRQAYTLNFSTLSAHTEFGSGADAPRAIAFITDGAQPITLDAELLRNAYGLTPAEIRLMQVMTDGVVIEEAAAQLGVTTHTVRAHLRSIYLKTNTNNRARLMRLLMSLAQITMPEGMGSAPT